MKFKRKFLRQFQGHPTIHPSQSIKLHHSNAISYPSCGDSHFQYKEINQVFQIFRQKAFWYFTDPLIIAERIICTPTLADSITEGVLSSWEKKVGDVVSRDEVIANIETDKITLPITTPEHGKIIEFFAKEGDNVTVGSQLFKIDSSADTEHVEKPQEPVATSSPQESPIQTPKAAELPQKNVKAAKETKAVDEPKSPSKTELSYKTPSPSGSSASRTESRKRLTPMRAKIAAHLKESQNINASLTTFNEIDMSSLIEFRSIHKDAVLKNDGVKLGFMSPFIMAATRALQENPMVNSRIEGSEIVTPSYVDISVAVSTPKGLVTPIIRDCQLITSFVEIEKTLSSLADLAKSNGLTQEHLKGGTFTISNGGVFGSLSGTPIINLPQSAILGMHAIKERPVAIKGNIVIRPMMNVALTYDHRIIDGRDAVMFLVRLKALLEDPRLFLL